MIVAVEHRRLVAWPGAPFELAPAAAAIPVRPFPPRQAETSIGVFDPRPAVTFARGVPVIRAAKAEGPWGLRNGGGGLAGIPNIPWGLRNGGGGPAGTPNITPGARRGGAGVSCRAGAGGGAKFDRTAPRPGRRRRRR